MVTRQVRPGRENSKWGGRWGGCTAGARTGRHVAPSTFAVCTCAGALSRPGPGHCGEEAGAIYCVFMTVTH